MISSTALTLVSAFSAIYALYLLTQPTRIRPLGYALVAGAAAFGIAFAIHNMLVENHLFSIKQIYLFGAPLVEEVLKAGLLLAVASRIKALQPGEGTLYGFGVGIGFAIAESAAYISSDPTQAMSIAAARSVSVNLMHGIGVALVGYGIAIYVMDRFSAIPTLILVGGAVVFHAANNYLTIEMGMYGTASAIALSITGMMMIALLTKMGSGFAPQENAISSGRS